MVGKTGSGRRPGFKHSRETKEKISRSKKGQRHSPEHRESISQAKLKDGLAEKCTYRFEDLKSDYPEQEAFFDENEIELLFAMEDVRTEQELLDIRLYIENAPLRSEEPYQYSSSSCYAAEDAMIALLDFSRFLRKAQTQPVSF